MDPMLNDSFSGDPPWDRFMPNDLSSESSRLAVDDAEARYRVNRVENDGWVGKSISRAQSFMGWQTPLQIVRELMMMHEEPLILDGPDEIAFFANRQGRIAIGVLMLIAIGLVPYWQVRLGLLVAIGLILASLVRAAFSDHYTRYVITTDRVMYITGVVSRKHMWIPYSKVTDLSYSQTVAGRALGIARVRIESANEASPFRTLENLGRPKLFMHTLSTMVNLRQAPVRGKGGFGATPKKREIMNKLMDELVEEGVNAFDSRHEVLKAVFDDWTDKDLEEHTDPRHVAEEHLEAAWDSWDEEIDTSD